MKLKLDENLGQRGRDILSAAGHDMATVASQSLEKAEDAKLIECCRREKRAMVSLDLDFANPLHFRPSKYFGIAVLRLPR
jgi:predicted nuclease of predicted toxin-antitoxin system